MQVLAQLASHRLGRWAVILLWIAALGAVMTLAPALSDVSEQDSGNFLPDDAEATRARELASERFASDETPAFIVFHRADGLTDDDRASAEALATWLDSDEAPEEVASVIAPSMLPPEARAGLESESGTTLNVIAALAGDPSSDRFADVVEAIREEAARYDGENGGNEGLEVLVGGPAGLTVDLVGVFATLDTFLLLVTVALVLVLLLLIYRSPVVALVPLVSVGIVFQLANGVSAWAAQWFDLTVGGQATGIMTVVLFGAGTDYTLFVSARYREELGRVEDKVEAMRRTMRGIGGAIASAGGTILLAAAALLLASLRSYEALGPVITIAVALMMLAALTLIPAILVVLGRFSFWPFQPQYSPEETEDRHQGEGRIYGRVADFVLERPKAVLAATVVVLGIAVGGMVFYQPQYDLISSLPSDTESVRSFEVIREGFPPGEVSPIEAYLELPEGRTATSEEGLATIEAVSAALAEHPDVASVTGPSRPFGEPMPPGGSSEGPPGGDGGPPPEVIEQATAQFISEDERLARLEVVLGINPYEIEALDLVPVLRDVASDAAEAEGLPRGAVLLGGEPAESHDTRVANNRDTLVILPLVLLLIMVVLGLLLRSVVAPIYLGATIVFTYFSTLGLSLAFFTLVLGHDGISSSVPFFLFVFLNALGVDYNIYLMSRVREESQRSPLREATRDALASTGGVITSAGLILAGTFSALMTLPLQDLFQLGFAVAIGVLMDTFITRTLIVPSIVMLLGHWNWWPSRASRAVEV